MKILFHICCAPCAIAPIKLLKSENHEIIGYWFNPNIHPYREWLARRESVEKLAELERIEIIWNNDYDLINSLKSLLEDPKIGNRCERCYEQRLEKTALTALENKCDAFSSSILYSKYQFHEIVKNIGNTNSEKFGIPFFYSDFRTLWGEGIKASREASLYRQKWCGCIFSELESCSTRKSKKL